MTKHPITPPPELVNQWRRSAPAADYGRYIAIQAAQWGADQELEACCEWVSDSDDCLSLAFAHLRAARRPKPPSLKEQALDALGIIERDDNYIPHITDTIRCALEALDD